MDVIVSCELTDADESHLNGKYRRYFHTFPKCKHSNKKRQLQKNDRCHICYTTVAEQSSRKPNIESKYNCNSYDSVKNNYQYFSDSELCKMPLDFENSSLKNSFSMSSLQPSSRHCLEKPSQATNTTPVLPNRAYNSLNHKLRKRSPEQESWRNSWGQDDQKDEFWTSFESNYQYLMNNNLIDSCKEAKNDLNASPSQDWTYGHFKQQFLDLDAWLNSIQKTIYANEDNLTVQNIRLSQIEEMKRKNYQRKNFVNQSSRLVTRYPEYKDEILDCVSQLNTKWDQLAQTMSPNRVIAGDCFSIRKDVHYELRCLSKWIVAMENKMEPVNFRKKWSLSQLKQKAKEHEAIQKDVESHRKTVLSVVKLCEKYSQSNSQSNGINGVKRELPLKKAQRWERRWQYLYLKCLEWQCYIENQISSLRAENSDDTGAESDDEQPASKHRRLNGYVQTQDLRLSVVNKCEDSDVDDIMDTGESVLTVLNNDRMTVPRDLDYGQDAKKLESDSSMRNMHSDIQLNDNFHSLREYESLNKAMSNEFTLFNKTVNSAPNVGVHYIRHEDTDPEQEKNKGERFSDEPKSTEESSEDEWTYKNAANDSMETDVSGNEALNETVMPVDSSEDVRSKKELIQKLVERADELIHTPKKNGRKKCSSNGCGSKNRHNEQVREWLRKCHPSGEYNGASSVGDSCDASGETEDDDQCERRSSCDQTVTMIGSSQDNGIDISPTTEEPKVVLRVKCSAAKSRPFSMSALPHFSKLSSTQWASESALCALHKTLTPLKDAQGALSSSTVEECTTQTLEGSGCSVNSLRRRKLKHRRRSSATGRKGHSGSADSLSSLNYHESSTRRIQRSPVRLPHYMVRSDTFSEPMMRQRFSSVERAIASDPANCVHNWTSGTETEEELTNSKKCLIRKKLYPLPAFRFGPERGAVTCREKVASLTSAEEQLSSFSFSEHAWDDFQERYVSEAYSEEPVDPDQVKKVTDFGEDYRNYIDSHSDCASSFTKRSYSMFKHSTLITGDESSPLDSDSEPEDVHNCLRRSSTQLCNMEQLFAKQTAKPSSCFLLSESDFAHLRNTCRENIRCLRVLLERMELDVPSFMPQERSEIKSMLDKWENLEGKTDEVEKKCSLQRSIIELRKQLADVSTRIPSMTFQVEDRHQLEKNVQILQAELDFVKDKKSVMSEYNVRAHRLINDSKYSFPCLKDDINDLYIIWEETHQKISNQLNTSQQALLTWRQFDMHMFELKTVLREDHTALDVLDQALKQEESLAEDVTLTVQNIAKYLPDKRRDQSTKVNNDDSAVLDTDQGDCMSTFLVNTLSVEGSFSDSGISDSGSEQDMCEREKRLALLKKLARHLESILAPGSEALLSIMKKIDEAEEEIKELQQTCRTIIKTGYLEKENQIVLKKDKFQNDNFRKENGSVKKIKSGDPESDPHKGRSIFWRVLRTALPFHVAIVVLLCVACLLEPNCCDAINNLNLSLTPRLRYTSGPPPT